MHGQYRGLRREVDNGHKQHLDLLDGSVFAHHSRAHSSHWHHHILGLLYHSLKDRHWMVSRNFVVSSSALVRLFGWSLEILL